MARVYMSYMGRSTCEYVGIGSENVQNKKKTFCYMFERPGSPKKT